LTYFDLLVGRYGAEDYFGEALRREHVEANAANRPIVLGQDQTLVFTFKKLHKKVSY
jgi:hypothetical protein